MKFQPVAAVAVALLATPSWGLTVDHRSLAGRRSTAASATRSPVERVVKLLTEIKERIDTDGKVELKVYNRYACWCAATADRKAASIEKAGEDQRSHSQSLLMFKGEAATLGSEIDGHKADIAKDKQTMEDATNVQEKSMNEFATRSAENKQVLTALEQAIGVLAKGTGLGGALLQEGTRARLTDLVSVIPISSPIKPRQLSLLSDMLGSKYNPQSQMVQGLLHDMYSTGAKSLQEDTTERAVASKLYEELMKLKNEEIALSEKEIMKKDKQKALAELSHAEHLAAYDGAVTQKKNDVIFFDETKVSCNAKSEDWSERVRLRTQELAGIERAITTLSSDDSRKLFGKTIKAGKEVGAESKYDTGKDISPAFLQTDAARRSAQPARQAYAALKKAASQTHSFRLAALAVQAGSAKAGHFTKVLSHIDELVGKLEEDNAADIKKRDDCKAAYHDHAKVTADLDWKIEKNVARIVSLETLMDSRNEEKELTAKEIGRMKEERDQMRKVRTEENTAFKQAKADDQDAIDLLMAARDELGKYYNESSIDIGLGSVTGVLLQEPEFDISADEAPDAVFSHKGSRKGESKGIVSLMTMIIEDLNDEIKNDMKSEESAQKDYEELYLSVNKDIDGAQSRLGALVIIINQRWQQKEDEDGRKVKNEAEKDFADASKADMETDCDWLIGAFTKRATARKVESEGLRTAKEFLVGYQADNDQQANLMSTGKSVSSWGDFDLSDVTFGGLST